MMTVQVVDHSEKVIALLRRKVKALLEKAAFEIADYYRFELQASTAPPHSEAGQIPHAYFGHKEGGFGPVFGAGEPNNQPPEFSAVQTDYLATYIDHGVDDTFDFVQAFVGFSPSHVTTRDQNYLLFWDQNGRPWVERIYKRNRDGIAEEASKAFREAG